MIKRITFNVALIIQIGLIIVPFLLVFTFIGYETFQNRYYQELQTNLEVANAVETIFERFVQDVLRQEASIGNILKISRLLTPKDINILLARSRDEYKSIRTFRWVNPRGIIIASDIRGAIGYDLSHFFYIKEIINGKDWVVSDLYRSILTNELVFTISRAVRSDSGALQGIIVAVVDEAHLDQEFSLYRSSGGGISLIDSKGMLVYRFPRITANWDERNWLKIFPQIEKALNGNQYMGTAFAPFEGKERIFAYTPVAFGWVAVAGRTKEKVTAPIYEAIIKRAVLFLFVLSGGIIIPVLLSRRASKSVSKLKDYSESVARGEYTLDSQDFFIAELHILADSFKKMSDQVKIREESLRKEKSVLNGIINSTDVQLVHLDNDFNFLAVNQAYAKSCRKTPAELVGKNHFELFPNDEYEAIFKQIRDAGQARFFKDMPFQYPDQPERGTTFWDWSLAPIQKDGKVIGLAFALRETTEYKKAQDQLQLQAYMLQASREELKLANEQLEQKVLQRTAEIKSANLKLKSANAELDRRATKLRTLASELTLVEQRVRKDVAKVLHDHLQQILAAVKFKIQGLASLDQSELEIALIQLDDQIGEAIQVSRSVAAQLSPPILFDSGLPAALDWLSRWLEEHYKFKLQLEIDCNLPKLADDLNIFLFECARELSFNAVKHAGAGTATLTLRQKNENNINMVVADNGIGFNPEIVKSTADIYKGFGLFSIIERIPLFGGNFEINSSPGHGSCFSLNIPLLPTSFLHPQKTSPKFHKHNENPK